MQGYIDIIGALLIRIKAILRRVAGIRWRADGVAIAGIRGGRSPAYDRVVGIRGGRSPPYGVVRGSMPNTMRWCV